MGGQKRGAKNLANSECGVFFQDSSLVVSNPVGSTNSTEALLTVFDTSPLLSITQQGTNVVISWPQACASFALEETTSLSIPSSWSPSGAPVASSGEKLIATVPLGNGNKFFRLRRNH